MEEVRPDLLVVEFLESLQERAEKNFKGHPDLCFCLALSAFGLLPTPTGRRND